MTFSPLLIGSGTSGFSFLSNSKANQEARLAATPDVARSIADFKEKITSVTSVDDLLADRNLLAVALGAFGLDEDIDNAGFLRSVLESDLSDSSSLANRLTDPRYLQFASAFNFSGDTAVIPSSNPIPGLQTDWNRLDSAEDLFKSQNQGLLDRSLAAFGIDPDTNSVFLTKVLTADVDDPTSIVNRLDDKSFLSFARAYQDKLTDIPETFLAKFDDETGLALQTLGSAADLINDKPLLREVLNTLGLTSSGLSNNEFLLESVLSSDASDPKSFANRLGDPAFAELAGAFDFATGGTAPISIYDFGEVFDGKTDDLTSAEVLLEDDALLNATLRVYGLDATVPDTDFLLGILNSDLEDPTSEANTAEDPRYRAMAAAFGFGAMLAGGEQVDAQERLLDLVEATTIRSTPPATPEQYLAAFDIVVASQEFFDLPIDLDGLARNERVVRSDPTQDTSLFNLISEDRYRTLYNALDFKVDTSNRTYPVGFADALTDRYIERQFEASVGNEDTNMRIALSMGRELEAITNVSSSQTAQWFSVLSSEPLTTLFRTAFGLPTSFSSIDVEDQIEILQDRARRDFGTDNLKDFLDGDLLDDLRQQFLNQSLITETTNGTTPASSGYAAALTILSGG